MMNPKYTQVNHESFAFHFFQKLWEFKRIGIM